MQVTKLVHRRSHFRQLHVSFNFWHTYIHAILSQQMTSTTVTFLTEENLHGAWKD